LLGIKSKRLVGEDVLELDRLFSESKMPEGMEDYPEVDLLRGYGDEMLEQRKGIFPRTPQPRKRKVSVYDLMDALDKAMEVRQRRIMRKLPDAKRMLQVPESLDVTELIVGMYKKVKDWFSGGNTRLTFNQLLPADDKESKVFTFIPLLHLENERRINMQQQHPFGEIEIELLRRKQNTLKKEI
jgi:chromatin segregation and condensation protein Rec8/ScpA/Scc1 (kleisin family)